VTILLQKAKHAATDKKTGKSTSKSQFPLIYVHHAVTFVLCIGLWSFCSFLFVEHLLCVAYSPLEPGKLRPIMVHCVDNVLQAFVRVLLSLCTYSACSILCHMYYILFHTKHTFLDAEFFQYRLCIATTTNTVIK